MSTLQQSTGHGSGQDEGRWRAGHTEPSIHAHVRVLASYQAPPSQIGGYLLGLQADQQQRSSHRGQAEWPAAWLQEALGTPPTPARCRRGKRAQAAAEGGSGTPRFFRPDFARTPAHVCEGVMHRVWVFTTRRNTPSVPENTGP